MTEARNANDAAVMEEKRQQSPVMTGSNGGHGEQHGGENNSPFKVFVGGISRTTDEAEILSIFHKYNPKEVMIMRELVTQRPRGFGFITFSSQKDMDFAIEDMHNTRINGRVVTVSKARPFERPRGDRSPRRSGSPERRPMYPRREGEGPRDLPRRHHPNYHENDNGGQRPHYERHGRSYEPAVPSRRYMHDGRRQEDSHPSNQVYPPSSYDNRNERGNYGGDHDARRGGYRPPASQRNDDSYVSRGDGNRGGQWMDYDRRQQMRDREEGHRRWNQNDPERKPYNNTNYNNHHHHNRDPHPRWRSPDVDERRRDAPLHPDSRAEPNVSRGGGGHYGPIRRRGDMRRNEPYRHRSRSPDRRGR